MELTLEADPNGCGWQKPCPKIYGADADTVLVQGKRPDSATLAKLNLPEDEWVVEFPREVALAWARQQLAEAPDE